MPRRKTKRVGLSRKIRTVFAGTEVAALLEDVNGNLKVIADGVHVLDEKVERIGTRLETHERRLDRAEVRLDALDAAKTP